jgi:hypothetical protein
MMSTLTPTTMPIIKAVWTELSCEPLLAPNCVKLLPEDGESGAGEELSVNELGIGIAVEGLEAEIKLRDEAVAKSSLVMKYF